MIPTLLVSAAWLPAWLGWGALAWLDLLGGSTTATRQMGAGALVLLGAATLALVALVVAFVLPLSPALGSVLWAAGLGGAWRHRRSLVPALPSREGTAFLVFASLALSYLSSSSDWIHDTGLYHFQQIRWAREAPVALGLASLHFPLGHASSWFPLAAFLPLPGLPIWTALALNTALSLAAFAFFHHQASGAFSRPAAVLASALPFLAYGASQTLSGPLLASVSTDLPVALLALVVTLLCVLAPQKGAREWAVPLAAILGALSLTIKLSAALTAALGMAILIFRERPGRTATRGAAFALALILAWAARGLALSGCIAFPVAASCVGLPWAVSPATIARALADIRKDAVSATIDPGLSAFTAALARALRQVTLPPVPPLAAAAIVGLVLCLCFCRRRPRATGSERRAWALASAGALGALLFWAATAPDPRFGYGALVSVAALALAWGAAPWAETPWFRRAIFAVWLLLPALIVAKTLTGRGTTRTFSAWRLARGGLPTGLIWRTTPFEIRRPSNGWACFDIEPPCTPQTHPDLAARGSYRKVFTRP